MPVRIEIQDGPASALWMSTAVMPGTLSGNSFTPRSNALPRNQRFDFRISVRNTGNEATLQPVGPGPTGPFQTAEALVGGLISPNGNTHLEVFHNPAQFSDLLLHDAAGSVLQLYSVLPASYAIAYSPSGRYVVLQLQQLGGITINVYAAETVGSGSTAWRPGQLVYTYAISPQASSTQQASSGIGFVPTREMLFLTWSEVGGVAFGVIDLAPGVAASARVQIWHTSGVGQFLFSPGGDLLVSVPATSISLVSLYSLRVPISGAAWPWRSKGMQVAAAVGGGALSFTQVKATGFDAIRVTDANGSRTIDSPTPSLPAVAVNLWVDRSSTVFSTLSATQYPMGVAGNMNPPSAFIDRLAAAGQSGASADAIVDANWLAVTPPPGEHFCAIAEAFTTSGTLPADPRHRSGTALSLSEVQIAQRNLVVGP